MIRILFALSALLGASFAAAEPTLTPEVFARIYVPGGYDSNDHVQFVGEGVFRNSCFRPAPTEVRVLRETKQIFVGPVAYEYPGLCLQVILPFERTVEVGLLASGTWEVLQATDGSKLGRIHIREATSDNADDFLYAPVSQAFFRQKGNEGEVTLSGSLPTECMVLDEVIVALEADVIVLQPKAKLLSQSRCQAGRFPFTKVVRLGTLGKGRYLLHVRSLNGNAVNSLVDMN